ncbi:lactoylglutathione lyase [Halotalea alkalilenta]|uniref:lactoylglutathione lyase n=1 Tax=Halotalea alkalilenta TaxID=376489 RepID=UPI00047F29A8|nr:lactoylglutathione lyase [Halotalea alkalilenta]
MSFTEQAPGVVEHVPSRTRGFTLNHSMVRIKDPERALAFYTGILGMRLLRKLDFPEMRFTLYFLDHLDDDEIAPEDAGERSVWTFSRRGLLELTHNWGTEEDPGFGYHNGNSEPQGYGHICIAVPDLIAAVAWFDEQGVEFTKRPEQGKMKDVAFIKDPDGYLIEIVQPSLSAELGG